jgi:hypothetical protein
MHDSKDGLTWDYNTGVGFYPVRQDGQYGSDYWSEYARRSATPMGELLTQARIAIVKKHIGNGNLVDIGIGSGKFVLDRGLGTFGYDVNPCGVRWLIEHDCWLDPHHLHPENASFWDSLEHIENPEVILSRIQSHIFVSIPIFINPKQVLTSKHFKPSEHYWYFTRDGLFMYMLRCGFKLVEESDMEERLGREDIGTFVFQRVS